MAKINRPIASSSPHQKTDLESHNSSEPKKRGWSRTAVGLGAALIATVKSHPQAFSLTASTALAVGIGVVQLRQQTEENVVPNRDIKASPYPDGTVAQYLHNGTFGAPLEDGLRLDGVMVSRGDRVSNVIDDPHNQGGGIILSAQARKIFNRHSKDPQYASPEGRFKLAVLAAKKVRNEFMKKPVDGTNGQNDMASIHLADSRMVQGGSPFLSLTLNNFMAGYFGLGGVDNSGKSRPVNTDGKVFVSSVNNASTIYPVVSGKTKGIEIGNDPRPITDLGMTLAPEMKIPFAEMLIVGGYYFHGTLSVQEALKQPLDTLRQIPDLYGSSLSFQMLEPIKGKTAFYPFHHHLPRIKDSLKEKG